MPRRGKRSCSRSGKIPPAQPRSGSRSRRPPSHSREGGNPAKALKRCLDFRLLADLGIEIPPIWIALLDQLELPEAVPFLDLLLARDGGHRFAVDLVPHEVFHPIFVGEPVYEALAVLVDPFRKIGRDTDVESAVPAGFPPSWERRATLARAPKIAASNRPAGSRAFPVRRRAASPCGPRGRTVGP